MSVQLDYHGINQLPTQVTQPSHPSVFRHNSLHKSYTR